MNVTAYYRTVFLLLALAFGLPLDGRAQSAGAAAGMNAAMTKLFGNVPGFTAKASLRVLDSAGKESLTAPMEFAFLNGNLRTRMDMNQMKGKDISAQETAQLNQLGLAERISIIRQDKNVVYSIFPVQKSVLTVAFPKQQMTSDVQKTPLGKETLDSHPCTKNRVMITYNRGEQIDAITWNASDLKDFPIQIQTNEKGKTSIIHFAQPQFTKPDARLFEPPAGFTEFTTASDMMKSIAAKTGGGTNSMGRMPMPRPVETNRPAK